MMKNKVKKRKQILKAQFFSFPTERTLGLRSQVANENAIHPLDS